MNFSKVSNTTLAENYGKGETSGQGSNMFIEGDTIYSYGRHYKIAVKLNPTQEFATNVKHVFNPDRYSSTTNKHQAYVKRNLQSYIELPECNTDEVFLRGYVNQLKIEVDEVRTKLSKLKTKGVRFQQYTNKIDSMTERVKEVERFTVALYGGQAVHFIKEVA